MTTRILLLILLCESFFGSETEILSSNITHFNISHIIWNTLLYCGPTFVCDKSYLTQFGVPSYTGDSACGICSCHEICMEKSDPPCCPDIYFKYGYMECKGVSVVTGMYKPVFYSFITSCPPESDINLVINCTRDPLDDQLLFDNPPVTGSTSNRSYKNKHCALCNNITNFQEWSFEFQCPKTTDFNYLSSYAEISQLAKQKNCSISFYTTSSLAQKCLNFDENKINACNVSGTWRHYDEEIKMACHSSYEMSNIFCAMCNPPKFDPSLTKFITNCSNDIDSSTCSQLPQTEASFPYKNHFCLTCNPNTLSIPFQDVYMIRKMEIYQAKLHPFVTMLRFSFKTDALKYHINQLMRYSNDSSNLHKNLTPAINVKNLIRQSFALFGTGSCDPELLPKYTKQMQHVCSCELGCTSSCCDDFALVQPWTSVNVSYPANMRPISPISYLAIGGCMKENNIISHLCSNPNSSDFYQSIPLTKRSGNKETYANVFCYLCNQHQMRDLVIERVNTDLIVWGFVIQCKGYINYRYFSTLQDFINFAEQNDCFIQLIPSYNAVLSTNEDAGSKDVISKCDKSVHLTLAADKDVRYACEQIEDYRFPKVLYNETVYKNKFCVMCNIVNTTAQNETCDVTNNVTFLLNKTCLEFPRTAVCSNYRNRFCEICHKGESRPCVFLYEENDSGITTPPLPTISPITGPPGFRSMFSILAYDKVQLLRNDASCLPTQIYDDFFVSLFYI